MEAEFGAGALKVTPSHDIADFEIGQRHELEFINVLNLDATMNEHAGAAYAGMDRYACREQVVRDLEAQGRLEKIENHRHAIGHCTRCDIIVEPLVSRQWWLEAKPLAEPAIEAVRSGQIRILPEHFERIYYNWMENIRDWCISRQLWWGHRIPVWYCDSCENRCGAAGGRPHGRSGVRVPRAAARCGRTRTCSTPGLAPRCGRIRRWAGPTIRRTCAGSTPPRSWRPATTSSSSGWRA